MDKKFPQMTVIELAETMAGYMNRRPEIAENRVVILLAKPSMGSHASIGIESAMPGMDWDSGSFMLKPNKAVVMKTEGEEAFDMAIDLLTWLASKPVKRETYEVRTAKRIMKRLGRTDEDFEKWRKFFHRVE